jgi:hypothetical protein
MGRIYRPESKPEKDTAPDTAGVPGGRFYRPSSGIATTEDGSQAPPASATKAEWAKYAKSLGATSAEVKSLNRDALVEKYGTEAEETPAEVPDDPAAETVQEEPVEAAKEISVATGALEPPEDAAPPSGDPAAETQQEEPIEAAVEVGGPAGANQPKNNASRGEWETFARSQGASDEDLEGLGRNDIRAKYQLI